MDGTEMRGVVVEREREKWRGRGMEGETVWTGCRGVERMRRENERDGWS